MKICKKCRGAMAQKSKLVVARNFVNRSGELLARAAEILDSEGVLSDRVEKRFQVTAIDTIFINNEIVKIEAVTALSAFLPF